MAIVADNGMTNCNNVDCNVLHTHKTISASHQPSHRPSADQEITSVMFFILIILQYLSEIKQNLTPQQIF